MAAAQAGLSRIEVAGPQDGADESEDAYHVARVSALGDEGTVVRGQALLHRAIDQALSLFPDMLAGSLLVCVAAPARFRAGLAVARQLVGRFAAGALPELETEAAHGSASLLAVERAAGRLSAGEIDFALVAAADARTSPEAIAELRAADRIIVSGRSFGLVPGEAAAAVLLASERGLHRLNAPSLGILLSISSAHEPYPMGAGRPCVGTGLTLAASGALSKLAADVPIDGVMCDLNGERFRTDEWGFTVPRIAKRLRDPGMCVAPVTAWGDCGAANGPLLLALATSMGARGIDRGAHMLVWTSSDGPDRAAAVLRASVEPETVAETAWRTSGWARDLDEAVLSEMAEECAFRYGQRSFQLDQLAGEEIVPNWRAIERAEEVIGTLSRGLAECGGHGWEVVTAAASQESPGSVYAAVRTLLEAGQLAKAVDVAGVHVSAELRLVEPCLLAFQHARRSSASAERCLPVLLAAGGGLIPLAVELAASTGVAVPASALAAAVGAVGAERILPFIRALGQLATPDVGPLVARWRDASDLAIRQEVAVAEIKSGGPAAIESLLARTDEDPALLLPTALVVDARQLGDFLDRATSQRSSAAILAVGMAGDVAPIPWLLDRLAEEDSGPMASCALEILLGTAPVEDFEIPNDDDSAPPTIGRRVSRDPAAWSPIADAVVSRHPIGQRLRGGVPATAAAAIGLLGRPHLPTIARHYLGHELAVRWGVNHPFDPRGLVSTQRAWFLAAERRAMPAAPGSWALARRW
jgi:3-oxoacyl-[acyl-carrier-protein] synthase-1